MTPKEEAALRLVQMNAQIRSLAVVIEDAAILADANDASGVAFSCWMLRDSLLAYCKSVNDYAADVLPDF